MKLDRPTPISIRQKIIAILWDIKKETHREQMEKLPHKLLTNFPQVIELNELIYSFRKLFEEKQSENLIDWLENDQMENFSFIQSFAQGIWQDINAVKLSIEMPWRIGSRCAGTDVQTWHR
ncbi:hypothetical protein B0X71_14530 [Planococcus lenghuensis]|uniref:Uncharacterized protein n=1 Tax=Planococcus lenghuensis TaxID=2213202 RepID=A0A1Q2L2C6_9BACL|nr:hypothetical protein B0X71_14530 [Planococcus lenghuensis]